MNVIFIGGPNTGVAVSVGDDVTSIGPIGNGTYVRTSGVDSLGRVEFRWVENQAASPEVKRAALVSDSPPPLNPVRPWPYKIDPLPAAALFGTPFASIAPRSTPEAAPENPHRKEPQ